MSAANWLETAVRVDLSGQPIASDAFDDLVRDAGVIVEAVTSAQAQLRGGPIAPTARAPAIPPV